MRRMIPFAALLLACAPAATTPIQTPSQAPPRVQANGSGFDVTLNNNAQPMGGSFDVPVDKLWPLAAEAYLRVGLKADASDAATHQVRGMMTLRRQLNGKSLSNYFDCGQEMTGPIADSWRVTVEALMAVGPGTKPDNSMVQTMLTVNAKPIEGTSTTLTHCSSRGQLEALLVKTIQKLIQAQPGQ